MHSEFSSFAVKHDACAPDGHISGLQDGKSHSSVLTRSEGIFSVVSSTAFWGEKVSGGHVALVTDSGDVTHGQAVHACILDGEGAHARSAG